MIVLVAQAAVGYTQYFTHLPAALVELHVLGATALVIGFTQFFLALTYHAPEAIPAADMPANLRAARSETRDLQVAPPEDSAALSGR